MNPARGAPLDDIVPAVIVGALAAIALLVLSIAYRRGRVRALAAAGELSERVSGMPRWAAIPSVVTSGALLIAVFGFYWDVSWHIDRGRDPGPLANPAHWFILIGLAGVFLAGVLSIVLGDGRQTRGSVRVGPDWNVAAGGVLLTICGFISLAGFPLDDVWHRLFGQDVTLWGPTHIQMIGGASLATLAMLVLLAEAPPEGEPAVWLRPRQVIAGGAFLLGLSTLQGEFDFGVPQFNQLYHPVLIMLAAGIGLVAIRVLAGRGAALGAVAFFLVVRVVLAVLIGPVLERSLLHFPLYVVEAIVVEVVALRIGTDRQLSFGLWAGLGIGTVGLAAEWLWSQIFMPFAWRASLLPEAVIFGLMAAVAAGVIGAFIGRSMLPAGAPRQRTPRGVPVVAWAVFIVVLAWPLPITASPDRAEVTLTPTARAGWVNASVQLTPADTARNARWFNMTAWQGRPNGDQGLVISHMREAGAGVYETEEPVPVGGSWKVLLRLHTGRAVQSVPVWMPFDAAIPAAEVPAAPNFTRTFVPDKQVLQREAKTDNVWLERAAYALLLCIGVAWVASMAWGLRRLERPANAIVGGPVSGTADGELTSSAPAQRASTSSRRS